MDSLYKFLVELDKLKSVYRDAYISDLSRNENSAEHSWHLAIAILALKDELNIDIDMMKTIKMALVHDICEIGAGDISIYKEQKSVHRFTEQKYIRQLSDISLKFGSEIEQLWEEYESQVTPESKWVKVVDRLLPFVLNLSTEGKLWKEQGRTRSQVLGITRIVESQAPEIYQWMVPQIEKAVKRGWLIDE